MEHLGHGHLLSCLRLFPSGYIPIFVEHDSFCPCETRILGILCLPVSHSEVCESDGIVTWLVLHMGNTPASGRKWPSSSARGLWGPGGQELESHVQCLQSYVKRISCPWYCHLPWGDDLVLLGHIIQKGHFFLLGYLLIQMSTKLTPNEARVRF